MKKGVLAAIVMSLGVAHSAAAAPIQWVTNGHYYEFFAGPITWDNALLAADGLGGYLATITSAEENAFLYASVTQQTSWVGGSDAETEGVWKWVTGPEAGTIFYGPGAPVGAYSNWAGGEPNDQFGEDALTFAHSVATWNDLSAGSQNDTLGYIVEWNEQPDGEGDGSNVPEPATLMLLGLGGAVAVARRRRQR